jgi:long-subunit fatty acid transport protein
VNAQSDLVYLLTDYDDISREDFPIIVDDLDLLTNNYFTIGFTYSRRINQNFTVGISPRINSNLIGIKTTQISYRIDYNDPNNGNSDTYDATFNGEAVIGLPVEINENAINGDELDLDQDLFPENWENDIKFSDLFKNIRLGFDLGATYTYNKWFFSASLLNIGASGWNTNGYKLRGNDESVKIEEGEKIKVGIPAKFYLGAKRQFSPNWNYGIILNNTFYNTGLNSSATISLNGLIGKALSTSVSYTAGYKYDNLGAGIRLRFFPGTDLFVATDNIIQLLNYRNAYCFSAAVGLNISVGMHGKRPLQEL